MAAADEAKKRLAEDRKLVEAGHQQYQAQTKGRPVPTQEQADLGKLGINTLHKESGAAPEPRFTMTRHMEGGRPGGAYQTRAPRPSGGAAAS